MTGNIVIEPISERSFPEFIHLVRELARFEHLDPPDEAAEERLRQHAFQERPFYEAFLARLDGKAIGYIIYFLSYSSFKAKPTLYLEDIFLEEQYRGQGFGKEMFLFVVRKADEIGCGRMEWSALKWNKKAIDFYLAMGAKPLDEWTYYRMTEDTILATARRPSQK
ncbi:MAG: Acetyltransferase (GNAT) family protein [Methanomassiliicoccales archaeon PtaU1.Bin124]|nr:MAG: Acetyltransferase (GNAT) family protein [Methanomassiliicoccales archaeon PtaU1.Bin124]